MGINDLLIIADTGNVCKEKINFSFIIQYFEILINSKK